MKPYFSSNATGTELVALGNSNLKWQQTGTWNVGLELSLLKGRFTTRAEYYIKNTKNSLAQITLAPSVGFASYPENMGNLETKGVELNFSFIPYRNLDKDAYWVITVYGSHNEEKLTKIPAMKKTNLCRCMKKESHRRVFGLSVRWESIR